MNWTDPLSEHAHIIERWKDPRPDIGEDHRLWVFILTKLFAEDRELWGLFYSLRCGGSRFVCEKQDVVVRMPDDWKWDFRARVKKKYLMPRRSRIESLLQEVAAHAAAKKEG